MPNGALHETSSGSARDSAWLRRTPRESNQPFQSIASTVRSVYNQARHPHCVVPGRFVMIRKTLWTEVPEMAEEEREEEAPEAEPDDGRRPDGGDVARIVSEHAEGDERFEDEMREFMRRVDARLTQLADAQAAIVSTTRIDDNEPEPDESDSESMDDGVLDLIIND